MSKLTFLKEFLRAPGRVGSLWPSSRYLARRVVDAAQLQAGEVVVELGAGVGPITSQLYAYRDRVRLLALEPNANLTTVLRAKFPGLDVVEAYAQNLKALLSERGLKQVDCVVSCLPWAIWPAELRDEVLDTVKEVIRPGGRLVCFSYLHLQPFPPARRLRRALRERFTDLKVSDHAWRNVPPAVVLTCFRREG